jgi:hypothetical protein
VPVNKYACDTAQQQIPSTPATPRSSRFGNGMLAAIDVYRARKESDARKRFTMKTIKRSVLSASASAISALLLLSGCVANEPEDKLSSDDVEEMDSEVGEAVSLIGTAQMRVMDDQDESGSPSDVKYYLLTGPKGAEKVELTFTGLPYSFEPGDEVQVKGRWQGEGDSRTIVVDQVISSSAQWGGPETAMSVIGRGPTAHKAAILMIGSLQLTSDQAEAMLSTYRSGSAAAFIGETSGLLDTFEAHAFKFPAIDLSTCANDIGPIKTAAMTAFKNAGNNPADYTNIIYLMGGSCPWFANASTGFPGSTGQNEVSISEKAFAAEVFSHEVGHNLGMNHAHSTRCGANVYNASRSGCTDDAYGNFYDAMGSAHSAVPSGHYSAPKKRFMGYLTGCEDVTAGGNAVFQISPTEGSCGMRSLRIPIAGEGNYYYLEYHKHGAGQFDDTSPSGGVLLNVSSDPASGAPETYLLDGTPATSTFVDAFLVVGQKYTLPGNVSITVQSLGDVAKIQVTMPAGAGATCQDNTAPPSSGGVVGGLCSAVPTVVYQAEDATSHPNATVASSVSGYKGTGYVNFTGATSQLAWDNVNVPRYMPYVLNFRYANPTATSKVAVIYINGQKTKALGLPSTGAAPSWGQATTIIPMRKGINKIQIGPQLGGVLIDQVVISIN